ncbi:MAG: adenosylcobalamin-dependent ribonucleoside-diphosphate reductase [Chloroflexi bacterium]|nr:adenosylcobalamin-dependent ribonucleoside-diphosphate reductase [Chloroflexota bacterium]
MAVDIQAVGTTDSTGRADEAIAPGTVLEGVRAKVFLDRYSLKNPEGKPTEQTPEEMWRRVARGIATVETTPEARQRWEQEFYRALQDFRFVPGGRILTGAGSGHEVTFYNCYVIPSPDDSRGGILDNLKVLTEIMARGGGVGVNLSTLRPRGSYIKTVNGTASGPVSWAELYSVITGDVIQQGGSRRGALMIMLDDDHPDVLEFVNAKKIDPLTNRPVAIEHANISVAVSDAFMQAVADDGVWPTQFPTKAMVAAEPALAAKVTPGPTFRAREIWRRICESAWATAEPGVVFTDRYNAWNNTWYYQTIRCTNPCGEQGISPWSVCNLAALNLSSFVTGPIGAGTFDYAALERDVRVGMRFSDNVIDANLYFFEENADEQLGTRRTGLGTMGLADALIRLGIRYGSAESEPVIERIYRTIRDAAYDESVTLAIEKGVFPRFDRDKFGQGKFIKTLPEALQARIRQHGIRNAVLLTQAPTGTTSLLAGVSSGIEPVFDFAYRRVDRTGESIIYHPLLKQWMDDHPDTERPDYFVGANDLTPEDHIRVQAMVQKYTDSSISKTCNAPNDHTIEEVERLYQLAYASGCKGVTYYRDGSRDAVLHHIEEKKPAEPAPTPVAAAADKTIRQRPAIVRGYTRNMQAPEGKVNITLNSDEQGLLEVFVNVGRAGSDIAALAEALGRLISLVQRLPSPLSAEERTQEIVNQLRGIGGSRTVGFGLEQVRSLPDAIGLALQKHLEGAGEPVVRPAGPISQPVLPGLLNGHAKLTGNLCPDCGSATLVFEEGCKKCHVCGYSEC